MPLDTQYFKDLELDILALFDDLDSSLDGWLIHSENYQALNTILPKFHERVNCVYIDPPYNTDASAIIYENRYKHSSWCLIHNRLGFAKEFLSPDGMICVTIDDYEANHLQFLMDDIFGSENYLATIVIRNNPSGRSTVKGFAVNHEYGFFYAKSNNLAKVGRFPHSRTQKDRYDNIDIDGRRFEWENLRKSSSGSRRADRPKQYFPFYFDETKTKLRIPKMRWDEIIRTWIILEEQTEDEIVILPIDDNNQERVWNYGFERIIAEIGELQINKKNGKFEISKKKFLTKRAF